MKKLDRIAILAAIIVIALFAWSEAHAQTISPLPGFVATSTPDDAITQRIYNKAIKITGLSTGQCLTLNSHNVLTTTSCGSGGTGLSTTTPWVNGQIVQVSSAGVVKSIATSTLGLLTTDVAEGANLYWTNTRFDNRLSATTTLSNLTTLANLGTIKTSLTGLIKAASGVLSTAANGTDYTLITANTCSAGQHVSQITAAGVITCSADSGGGGSGSVSTSTPEVAGEIPFFTSTAATPALIGGDTTFVWDNTNKRIGIGSSTPYTKLAVSGPAYIGIDGLSTGSLGTNFTSYTTDLNSNVIANSFQAVGPVNASGNVQAVQFTATDNGTNNTTTMTGLNGLASKTISGTVGTLTSIQASARISGTAVATTLNGFVSQTRVLTGSSATTVNNFNASAATVSGTVGTSYGFHAAAQKISGVSTGYGIATDGATDLNYTVGNFGAGTTSPYAQLSVGGNAVIGAASAGGTNGDLFINKLGVAAGTFLAADPTGKVIATTSPAYTAGTGLTLTGNSFSVNTSQNIATLSNLTGNGLVKTSGGVGTLGTAANGTDYTLITANTCSAGQHVSQITAAGVITCSADTSGSSGLATSSPWSGSGVAYRVSDAAVSTVATSSLTLASEFTNSGTTGALVGGSNGTLSLTTNGTALSKLVQIGANTVLGNNTGATGNVVAFATSTLGIAISDTTGTLAVARGGTGAASLTGIVIGNGTSAFTTTAGTTCTNQFLRAFTSSAGTCATVGAADVSLANLTATDSTLTFSGTYTGATARTIGLNLGNANSWTGLQSFANSTTTLASHTGTSWFGATATTTINADGKGSIVMPATSTFTLGTTTAGTLKTTSSGLVYADTAGSGALSSTTAQTFTTAGAGTWTKPTGVRYIEVEVVGAGGQGGGDGGGSSAHGGDGGGSGGYGRHLMSVGSTPSINFTIGTKGSGAADATGNAGTATTFDTCVAGGGSGGSNGSAGVPAGAGGTTSGCNESNFTGNAGNIGMTGAAKGGTGGNSFFGGSGLGQSGAGAGNAGTQGSGGGGAAQTTGSSNGGGAGGDGEIVVHEYY
jgi:hypothetical protein